MKETTTLGISGQNNLLFGIVVFLFMFTVVILFSFVLRIFSLGFYRVNFNKKFLRKYIEYTSVLASRRQ